MESKRFSFAPEDQVQGASFFNDVDVQVVDAYTEYRDLTKKDGTVVAVGVPFATLKLRPLVDGGEQHEFEENWSVGDKTRVAVTADKTGFEPAAGKTWDDVKGIVETTRWGQFTTEAQKNGFPKEKLKSGNIKEFIGTKAHLLRIDPPKKSDNDKNKLAVFTKIHEVGGGAPGTSGGDAEAEKEAVAFIRLVVEKAGKATMAQLGQTANKKFAGKPNMLAIVSKVLDTKLLQSQQGWIFNGREVSKPEGDSAALDV